MGIVRTIQFVATLVVAGPVAMASAFNFLEGEYVYGVVLLAAAVGLVVVSEYLYVRLTDRTVGRVKRLRNAPARFRRRRGAGDGDDKDKK